MHIWTAMILQQLKDETRESHSALEHQMPLLDAALQASVYQRMVQQLYTYHKPFEVALLSSTGFAGIGIDYSDRSKTARLARDLDVLGMNASEVAQLPLCTSLPPLTHPSHIFGCLYVLEGATLGGQIVARHLQASLGLTPDTGASYFSGYGLQTGAQWKVFCARLTAYAAGIDDTREILAGAHATYFTLSAWMGATGGAPTTPVRAHAAAQPALAGRTS